jgi:hypothetical protein
MLRSLCNQNGIRIMGVRKLSETAKYFGTQKGLFRGLASSVSVYDVRQFDHLTKRKDGREFDLRNLRDSFARAKSAVLKDD